VRPLNTQEQAVLTSVKPVLGISGGSKKIKSKDLIGMKKNLKGGQSAATPTGTDPRSRTYSGNVTNGYLVDKFDRCEGTRYQPTTADSSRGLTAFSVSDTDNPFTLSRLKKCLVGQMFVDTRAVASSASPYATSVLAQGAVPTGTATDPLPYTGEPMCTRGQGERVLCSTIPTYSVATRSSKFTPTRAAPTMKGYRVDGTLGGGSRKTKSRSPPPSIKNRSPNRKMARKSSRRATRRASSRKGSRKGSRKTRRNRK
jgi:hypothetical protein